MTDKHAQYQQTLAALVDFMLPRSSDGGKPGAVELGVADDLASCGDSELHDGLAILDAESELMFKLPFYELRSELRQELVHSLRHKLRNFFARLNKKILQVYYQKDRVLDGLGLGARPPFPDGYHVREGDLSLLFDVYERGEIYRKG